MARIQLPITDSSLTGAATTYTAVDGVDGNYFTNTGSEYLIVKNGSASSVTVTIKSVPCSHGRTGDAVVSIPASGERTIGPFPRELFNQPSPNWKNVNVDFSAATSVTAAVIKP
jgi:hypothetical protein